MIARMFRRAGLVGLLLGVSAGLGRGGPLAKPPDQEFNFALPVLWLTLVADDSPPTRSTVAAILKAQRSLHWHPDLAPFFVAAPNSTDPAIAVTVTDAMQLVPTLLASASVQGPWAGAGLAGSPDLIIVQVVGGVSDKGDLRWGRSELTPKQHAGVMAGVLRAASKVTSNGRKPAPAMLVAESQNGADALFASICTSEPDVCALPKPGPSPLMILASPAAKAKAQPWAQQLPPELRLLEAGKAYPDVHAAFLEGLVGAAESADDAFDTNDLAAYVSPGFAPQVSVVRTSGVAVRLRSNKVVVGVSAVRPLGRTEGEFADTQKRIEVALGAAADRAKIPRDAVQIVPCRSASVCKADWYCQIDAFARDEELVLQCALMSTTGEDRRVSGRPENDAELARLADHLVAPRWTERGQRYASPLTEVMQGTARRFIVLLDRSNSVTRSQERSGVLRRAFYDAVIEPFLLEAENGGGPVLLEAENGGGPVQLVGVEVVEVVGVARRVDASRSCYPRRAPSGGQSLLDAARACFEGLFSSGRGARQTRLLDAIADLAEGIDASDVVWLVSDGGDTRVSRECDRERDKWQREHAVDSAMRQRCGQRPAPDELRPVDAAMKELDSCEKPSCPRHPQVFDKECRDRFKASEALIDRARATLRDTKDDYCVGWREWDSEIERADRIIAQAKRTLGGGYYDGGVWVGGRSSAAQAIRNSEEAERRISIFEGKKAECEEATQVRQAAEALRAADLGHDRLPCSSGGWVPAPDTDPRVLAWRQQCAEEQAAYDECDSNFNSAPRVRIPYRNIGREARYQATRQAYGQCLEENSQEFAKVSAERARASDVWGQCIEDRITESSSVLRRAGRVESVQLLNGTSAGVAVFDRLDELYREVGFANVKLGYNGFAADQAAVTTLREHAAEALKMGTVPIVQWEEEERDLGNGRWGYRYTAPIFASGASALSVNFPTGVDLSTVDVKITRGPAGHPGVVRRASCGGGHTPETNGVSLKVACSGRTAHIALAGPTADLVGEWSLILEYGVP